MARAYEPTNGERREPSRVGVGDGPLDAAGDRPLRAGAGGRTAARGGRPSTGAADGPGGGSASDLAPGAAEVSRYPGERRAPLAVGGWVLKSTPPRGCLWLEPRWQPCTCSNNGIRTHACPYSTTYVNCYYHIHESVSTCQMQRQVVMSSSHLVFLLLVVARASVTLGGTGTARRSSAAATLWRGQTRESRL